MLPPSAYTRLGSKDDESDGLHVCRLITGLYPTASRHGYSPETNDVAREIADLVERGFNSFEMPEGADAAEAAAFVGAFRGLVGRSFADAHAVVAARVVLDARAPASSGRRHVESMVDEALRVMRAERIDLLLLKWTGGTSSGDSRLLQVLDHVRELRREGKVYKVGLVDESTMALRAAQIAGLRIDASVVPYSLLDRRPAAEMAAWCARHGVALIAHSSVGGGFLSERYMGVPEPTRRACGTPALASFQATIRTWGGWSLFQELLFALKTIANKYRVSVANVALRWVLEQKVAAVIVGARLALGPETNHYTENENVFRFELDDDDRKAIEDVSSRANDLYQILGENGVDFQERTRNM